MSSTTAATRSMTRARSGLRIDGGERPAIGMAHRVRDARRFEQRLGRHAAIPQAIAAEPVLFDQRDFCAERSTARRHDQAAGAAADDRKIEFRSGHDGGSAGQAGDEEIAGPLRPVPSYYPLGDRSGYRLRGRQWKSRERVGSAPSSGVRSTRRPASTCTTAPSRSTLP